jgi:hypothetical protein
VKQKSNDPKPHWEKVRIDGKNYLRAEIPEQHSSRSASWMKKIDAEGFQILLTRGLAKDFHTKHRNRDDTFKLLDYLGSVFPAAASKKTIEVSSSILAILASAGIEVGPQYAGKQTVSEGTAEFIENVEGIKALIGSSEFMGAVPIAGAFVLLIFRRMYESIARGAFGKVDLTPEQMQWTLGTVLRDFGRMLRKEPVASSKGRANTELLEMLRVIRTHQVEKLKPKEVKKALEFAGTHVPNDEALRIFEWRAKKKGQL